MARLLEALKRIESSPTTLPRDGAVATQNRPSEDQASNQPPNDRPDLPSLADGLISTTSAEKLAADAPQPGTTGSRRASQILGALQQLPGETTFELSILSKSAQTSYIVETVYSAQVTHILQNSCLGLFSETQHAAAPSVKLPETFLPAALTYSSPAPEPTPREHRVSQAAELAITPPLAEQSLAPEDKRPDTGSPGTDASHVRTVQPSEQRYDFVAQRAQEERHAHFGRQALAVMPQGDPRQVAFDNLAARIIGQLAGRFPAAIVFSSPSDRTGTTRTLVPLADALSRQMGGRLLLIDADYLKADLTARGQVYDQRGLWDAIDTPGQWQQFVCRTDLHGVFLLPGARHPFRADVCNVLGFQTLLHEVVKHFRLVVVDAPSLAHEGTVLLARQCEGLYLVARLQYTSARALEQAAQLLRNQQVRLLGCVVLEG